MRVLLIAATLAAAIALGACGGDEDAKGVQPIPAAGQFTPSERTPGVPPGAAYDVTAREWLDLEDVERFTAAQDYIADHPEQCGRAAADPVRDYADASAGTDYPLTEPMAELLAEGCAAALQSGSQDLQPGG